MKNRIKPGTKVRICDLNDTKGELAIQKYIRTRRNNAVGVVLSVVPGYGGQVWFVRHEDDALGAYSLREMELL
jgi:hypothetical protein